MSNQMRSNLSRVAVCTIATGAFVFPFTAAADTPLDPASLSQIVARPDGPTEITLPAETVTKSLSITRPVALNGTAGKTEFRITADQPILTIEKCQEVVISGVTFRWQLSSSDAPRDARVAVLVKDASVTFKNCRFIAAGSPQRCPSALVATGFSQLKVKSCHFEGFDFTVGLSGGAAGRVEDSTVRNPGHCGLTVYSGSTLEVRRCIVAGSEYHGIRNTGGTLTATDNLIIDNKNRGFYLGNKPASGRISNNVIARNAEGLSAFAQTDTIIENNLFLENTFAGADARSSCPIVLRRNLFDGNRTAVAVFPDGGALLVDLADNAYWNNEIDGQDIELSPSSLRQDPAYRAAAAQRFEVTNTSMQESGIGLSDASILNQLWDRYSNGLDSRP